MRFIVLHWSNNWVDGPSFRYCSDMAEAKKYVRDFQGREKYHSGDTYSIVEIIERGSAKEIDTGLIGLCSDSGDES
jgi:hypothetical protein